MLAESLPTRGRVCDGGLAESLATGGRVCGGVDESILALICLTATLACHSIDAAIAVVTATAAITRAIMSAGGAAQATTEAEVSSADVTAEKWSC